MSKLYNLEKQYKEEIVNKFRELTPEEIYDLIFRANRNNCSFNFGDEQFDCCSANIGCDHPCIENCKKGKCTFQNNLAYALLKEIDK